MRGIRQAIGLDRIPEVKTLRTRIQRFCEQTDVKHWSLLLSKQWMEQRPEFAGKLYIDGHVNLYYGQGAKMLKRYASRLRLCMCGSTEYWVNDKTGEPFFVISEVIAGGFIEKIKKEIIPRLDADIPEQPSEETLKENPLLIEIHAGI